MNTEPKRTCPSCGNELSGAIEFCPVCMLRKGLAGGVESGVSSISRARLSRHRNRQRNDLSTMNWSRAKTGNRSSWAEVRWASLTKRSIRSSVTCGLKGHYRTVSRSESARQRFLREARAAAGCVTRTSPRSSIRGQNAVECFYAMELVEGETLETACTWTWPAPAEVVVAISAQVAAGLQAKPEETGPSRY